MMRQWTVVLERTHEVIEWMTVEVTADDATAAKAIASELDFEADDVQSGSTTTVITDCYGFGHSEGERG